MVGVCDGAVRRSNDTGCRLSARVCSPDVMRGRALLPSPASSRPALQRCRCVRALDSAESPVVTRLQHEARSAGSRFVGRS